VSFAGYAQSALPTLSKYRGWLADVVPPAPVHPAPVGSTEVEAT
jgi:hypothetical protein